MGLACGPLPFVLGDKRKQKRRRELRPRTPRECADFLFMKIGTFSGSPGEPRRCFCFLLSLRAETRTKGSGRAVDNFLGRIAFFMRGHTATKVWPAGHLLSSHEERRQRRAKGSSLGAPGNFVDFLFRKIDLNAATLSTDIKKGLRPRAWSSCLFSAPRPP